MVEGVVMTEGAAFEVQERDAVYRAIATRRDVRRGFLDKPLPDDLIRRLLCAAHSAPSVGLMQPSRFILIRDQGIRRAVHVAFLQANERAMATYTGERREQYARLKLQGILEAPQNLCVVSDLESERGHQLGRHTMPETAIYSTVCAIQNLWLAARAEGVGVGWVSILDPTRLGEILQIPAHIVPVGYLCLGFVDRFGTEPELERYGWESRVPLEQVVSYDIYSGERGCSDAEATKA
jgi:5,6-dimethylbenzimidazole synthase